MSLKNFSGLGLLVLLVSQLTACGGFSVWPSSDNNVSEDPRTPQGAVAYQCDKGRKFYVKSLDKGSSVWMILVDREFGMAKTGSGNTYSNGISTLTLEGESATFNDGYQGSYANCTSAKSAPASPK